MRSKLVLFISTLLILSGCSKKNQEPLLFLPDDLEVTLWAESPMLYNPTNMDVDSRGRIWITEAVNYRNFNNDSTHFLHHGAGDRVMILEDTDHDGKADKSTVFVQDRDLVSPLGIAVLGNRIFVSSSPNLIVYTDSNGDDKPDSKEILLTGFGGKDHDHSLHSLVGGPDGRYYFNTGNAGPHIVKDKSGWTLRSGSIYTGGTPYNQQNQGNMKSDDGKVWVGGLALRINPDGTGLKVMGHNFRNSYEVIIDSFGNLWQNDNDDQVVACRTSWLTEEGNAGFFSTDGTRYWQADQRPWQDIFTAHWHQEDPGVMPAGDRTGAGSPTGIVVNEGDGLGEKYRGMLLSADAGRNVIFGYKPKINGSGFDLGNRFNFISSVKEDNKGYVWNDTSQNNAADKWFRPSDVTIGTDGAIYLADWYDPVVGGHQMKDSIGYGRIYRIARKGVSSESPKIDLTSLAGEIQALKNPAINVRFQAFEKLLARGSEATTSVKELLNDSNPFVQARAIWLLAQLDGKGKEFVKGLLHDGDEMIRATAFRALRKVEPGNIDRYRAVADDPSSFVKREVAVALRDLPFEKVKELFFVLLKGYDGRDRWYLDALGAIAEGNENEFFTDIKKTSGWSTPGTWSDTVASLVWRIHPSFSAGDLKTRAETIGLSYAERSRAITALAFINTKEAVQNMMSLAGNTDTLVREQSTYWLAFRQSNDWFSLVDWRKTGVDLEHERNLSVMKVRKGKILDAEMPSSEKLWNAQEMAKNPLGGQMLIVMASEKSLPSEVYPAVGELIFNNPDRAVRIQASSYFARPGNTATFSIAAILQKKGDAVNGEKLFVANCATCHRVKGKGMDLGPDLTLIQKKFDREGLLDAMVNPAAGVLPGYEPWLINTRSGDSYFGFLVADGKKAVVIRNLLGKRITIPVPSIILKKQQAGTLMPAPVSLGLTEGKLADIATYLLELR